MVILAFAAIVVDLGVLRNNRQILVNTMDSAALAGGTLLPVSSSTYAVGHQSYPGDGEVQLPRPAAPYVANGGIVFKCLIGLDASGRPDVAREVPIVCDPTHASGTRPSRVISSVLAQSHSEMRSLDRRHM